AFFFRKSTAHRKPSRSRAAIAGNGGPCGRDCRKGKSQRSTVKPVSANALLRATSSLAWQFPPAPWVSTRPWPLDRTGECRNPLIAGATEVSEIVSRHMSDCVLALNKQRKHTAGQRIEEPRLVVEIRFAALNSHCGQQIVKLYGLLQNDKERIGIGV